jgi:hypothetical protein
MLHEFLQVARCNGGRSPFRPAMAQEGREGNTFEILVFSSYFFFPRSPLFSFPFLFFRHREGGMERTVNGAQGYRGAQGQPTALNLAASVVKRWGPLRRSKGPGKLSLHASPTPRISR